MHEGRECGRCRVPDMAGDTIEEAKGERCMDQKWNFEVGDVVKLKKPHPCGSHEWEILRVGADFRLKCMGCGHQVMTERKMVEKNARGLTKAAEKQ